MQEFSKNVRIDKINIICMLGQGSYAKVYLVECLDQPNNRFRAMKMLSKEHLAGKIDYILNEKQIMIDFQHPFLLKLHQTFQCRGFLYLMLDFQQGGTLYYHLKK